VLFEVGRHEDAIQVCLKGKKYEKAKKLAQGNQGLQRMVEESYQGHLVQVSARLVTSILF